MSQHDLVIDNASGAAVRADMNNALAALGSTMKGPNAPPAPTAGMMWWDDDTPSATIWTLKAYDGADWAELGRLDVATNVFTPAVGNVAWADVASAATTNLSATSTNVRITGTTTITSFGTADSGILRFIRFAAALTLTHNATSLILPGAANITTAAGDTAVAVSLGSGNWVVVNFTRAAGLPVAQMATARVLGRLSAGSGAIEEIPLANAAAALSLGTSLATEQASTSVTSIDFTGIPAGVRRIAIMFSGVSTSGTSNKQIQRGDAGGVETTGYLGASVQLTDGQSVNAATITTGFAIRSALTADVINGAVILENMSGNNWVAHGVLTDSSRGAGYIVGGAKSLSATLDRVRITTVNGTDTFDAGSINISWEF